NCPPACAVPHPVPKGQTFQLTDIVFGNPDGDAGVLTVKRGSDVLFVETLQNFRDLDFHFVAPIEVKGGQELILDVKCANAPATRASTAGSTNTATAPTGPCTAAASMAGFVQTSSKKSAAKSAQ